MKGLNMLLNITSLFLSLSYITMFMSIYQQYLLCAILEEMLSWSTLVTFVVGSWLFSASSTSSTTSWSISTSPKMLLATEVWWIWAVTFVVWSSESLRLAAEHLFVFRFAFDSVSSLFLFLQDLGKIWIQEFTSFSPGKFVCRFLVVFSPHLGHH